jgi:hypothetical protein
MMQIFIVTVWVVPKKKIAEKISCNGKTQYSTGIQKKIMGNNHKKSGY